VTLRDGGELCVCDLAWITERAENLVGHHLRVLREAGLDALLEIQALTR
jgi:DNA-binding transcriptional ArsR family regulator